MKSMVQQRIGGTSRGGSGGGRSEPGHAQGQVRIRRKVNPASPPTAVELCNGITVHFPFRPYECQKDYMTKVLKALARSENALLESPTGTGKTLCLLCSTLAWQRSQAQLLMNGSQLPTTTSSQSTGSATGQTNPQPQHSQQQQTKVPTIIYASRTHSQLSQVVRELRNTRYRPSHAVLGSREHMCVHPKVKKPQASASDINHDCNKLGKERKCRFRNALDGGSFVPPSNEVLDVSEVQSGCCGSSSQQQHQPVMDMEELVQMGKTMNVCPFYYTRGLVENAELILVPYNYLFDKDARETTLQDVPWNNAVVIFDEAHNLESFASDSASFDLSNTDLAGCVLEVDRALNYLHVLSSSGEQSMLKADNLVRLKAIFLKLEDYLVHRIPASKTAFGGEFMMHFLQQAAGITHGNHEILLEEIRKVNEVILDLKGTGAIRGSPRLEHFATCMKRVFGHKLESKCLAKASFYRVHVSPKETGPVRGGPNNKTNGANSKTNPSPVSRTISYWCFAPALAMEELANLNVRSILVTSGTLSPLPSYSMELGLPFPHTLENPHIIDAKQQLHVRVIGRGVNNQVLSSSYENRKNADYYKDLGATLVRLTKVIPAGVLVFFPSYGVMDACLEKWGGPSASSSFGGNTKKTDFFAPQQRRKKKASTGVNQFVFPQIPSSSSTLSQSLWHKLLEVKSVVLEPRSSADLNEAIAEFQRLLNLPHSPGCILMGVCRGKISEGIDFANDMSRAVIITGIPFAPAMDAKVKLKREYLDGAVRVASQAKQQQQLKINDGGFSSPSDEDKKRLSVSSSLVKLSGNEWYTQQAHRAVNQAVGRVIRSRTDYGAVLLLDSRFDQDRNLLGLSKWIRPHVLKDQGFALAEKDLRQFYKAVQAKSFELVPAIPAAPACPPLFEKDDEENTENCAKVALIRRMEAKPSANSLEQSQVDSMVSGSYIPPDQVIATVSSNTLLGSMNQPSSHPSSRPSQGSNTTKKPVSYDSVFAKSALSTRPPKVKAQARDKSAVRFMEGTKSLSTADQAKIRKAIVTMKKSSDAHDGRTYHQNAHQVLDILIRHSGDKLTQAPQESLLSIFFQLLPQAYKKDTESLAYRMIFEASPLNDIAKKCIAPADHSRLKCCVLRVIQKLWVTDADDSSSLVTSSDPRPLIEDIHEALSILHGKSTDKSQSRPMCAAFVRMIPLRYKEQAQTIVDDMTAREKMDELKQRDRARVGAAGMDMRRFALPKRSSHFPPATTNTTPKEPLVGTKPEPCKNPYIRKRPSSMSSTSSSSTVPKNPYLRPSESKKPSSSIADSASFKTGAEQNPRKIPRLEQQQQQQVQPLQPSIPPPNHSEPTKPVTAPKDPPPSTKATTAPLRITNPYKKNSKSTKAPQVPQRHSLGSVLGKAESQVFVRSWSKNTRGPDSNAPKGLSCPLCDQANPKPFMAPCGHVACQSCWSQWMTKSSTCPTCRASCTRSDLVQAVFVASSNEYRKS